MFLNTKANGGVLMAFERFTKTRGRGYAPKVSIWSRGQIGFNEGCLVRYDLKQYKYAVLYYDKDNKKIGIKFTNNKTDDGAMKVIFRETGGASISANAFLGFYNIDHTKTKRYDVNYDEDAGMFIIEIA